MSELLQHKRLTVRQLIFFHLLLYIYIIKYIFYYYFKSYIIRWRTQRFSMEMDVCSVYRGKKIKLKELSLRLFSR